MQSLVKQAQVLQQKLTKEQMLYLHLSELSANIVGHLKAHGRLTVSQIVTFTAANRNTIKKHLQSLVDKGYIERHGKGRGVWYTLSG